MNKNISLCRILRPAMVSSLAAIVGLLGILVSGCATGFMQPVKPWYRQDPLQGQPAVDAYDALGTEIVDPDTAVNPATSNPPYNTQTRFKPYSAFENPDSTAMKHIPVRHPESRLLPDNANPASIPRSHTRGSGHASR